MSGPNMIDFFDQLFEGFEGLERGCNMYSASFPPLDVWMDKEHKDLYLEFAVAGISQDEIVLDTEGDHLFLEIDRLKTDRTGMTLIQRGISGASARGKYYVPSSKYKLEEIEAYTKDGILFIKIPARESIKPKKVVIERK